MILMQMLLAARLCQTSVAGRPLVRMKRHLQRYLTQLQERIVGFEISALNEKSVYKRGAGKGYGGQLF